MIHSIEYIKRAWYWFSPRFRIDFYLKNIDKNMTHDKKGHSLEID